MGRYYRRRRAIGNPLGNLIIDFLARILAFACIFGIFGVASLPSLFVVPVFRSPASSQPANNIAANVDILSAIGFLAICAILISSGGLIILGILWLYSRTKRQFPKVGQGTTLQPTFNNATVQPAAPNTVIRNSSLPTTLDTTMIPPTISISPRISEQDSGVDARHIMSHFERSFFWVLSKAVESDYYIFSQVRLRDLASQTQTRWLERDLKGMLNMGVVDFLLANPTTLEATIAFEFDDPSHRQADAQARDRRKERFMEHVNIPLMRFRSGEKWNASNLRKQIQESAQSGRTISFLNDSEVGVFKLLRETKEDFYIFPKVPVHKVINRKEWLELDLYKTLKNESVDFLLAHPKYLGTLLVVSLEQLEYSEIGNLLNQARIPWVSLSGRHPTPIELREKIHQALTKW